MRYDVEVSGFPSSHLGHLSLLGLKEDDYPGASSIEEWPSWTLPILRWARSQGAVAGYAHPGWGLEPLQPTQELPNYEKVKFDSVGANEYIVTVTHDAVDFLSIGDTPPSWELNIWYHTLNCGFRTRIIGESDFPCIYDERVGMGRSYTKLEGGLNYDQYLEQIRKGRSYVSDGRSHIIDFFVNEHELGTDNSEVLLDRPQQCWEMKRGKIREDDFDAAAASYDKAGETYDLIVSEATKTSFGPADLKNSSARSLKDSKNSVQ